MTKKYLPTNALNKIQFITSITTPACFGTRAGVLTLVINCTSLSASVGGHTDCEHVHSMDNIKFTLTNF
jgi:hypothetical protein